MSFEEWDKQNKAGTAVAPISGFEAWDKQNTILSDKKSPQFKHYALSKEGSRALAASAPEIATKIAAKEQPSRNDLKELGVSGWNAEERKQLSSLFRDILSTPRAFRGAGAGMTYPYTPKKPFEFGIPEIGKAIREMVAPTTPYTEKESDRMAGELVKTLENIGVNVLTLGGLAGPLMGLKPSELRAALREDSEELAGFGPALAPAAGETVLMAVEWGYLYPKLFATVGTAGKQIAKIPKVAKGAKALRSLGGIEKVATKYPRTFNAATKGLAAFTKGATVGTIMATPEALGEELPAGEVLKHIGKRAALLGGVSAGFQLASTADTAIYARRLRNALIRASNQRFTAKLAEVDAMPKGAAKSAANKSLSSLKKVELQQIDNIVSEAEAQLIGLKTGKMYQQGQELVETPQKAAERFIRQGIGAKAYKGEPLLKKGLGETKPFIEMPTTRAGEVRESVVEAAKAVRHPVEAARKAVAGRLPKVSVPTAPKAVTPPPVTVKPAAKVTPEKRQQAIDYVKDILGQEQYAALDEKAKSEIGQRMLAEQGVEVEAEEIAVTPPTVPIAEPQPSIQPRTTDKGAEIASEAGKAKRRDILEVKNDDEIINEVKRIIQVPNGELSIDETLFLGGVRNEGIGSNEIPKEVRQLAEAKSLQDGRVKDGNEPLSPTKLSSVTGFNLDVVKKLAQPPVTKPVLSEVEGAEPKTSEQKAMEEVGPKPSGMYNLAEQRAWEKKYWAAVSKYAAKEKPPAKAEAAKEIKDVEEKEAITEPTPSPEMEPREARKLVPTGKLDPTDPKEALEIIRLHQQGGGTVGGIFETKWDAEYVDMEGRKGGYVTTSVEYTSKQVDTAYRNIQKPVESPMPDTDLFAMPGKESQMKAIAQKMAKVKGVYRPKKIGRKGLTKPTALPKAKIKKEDHIKAVYSVTSKEESRYAINGVLVEGDILIATDGRRLFWAKGKWGKDGVYLDAAALKKGSLGKLDKTGQKFPIWRDIVPDVSDVKPIIVNLEAVWSHVRQATVLTSEESKGITVIENKDERLGLGFAAGALDVGHAEINVEPGGRILGALNPQFLLDVIKYHAIRGDTNIEFYFKDPTRPVLTKSLDGKTNTITMPINPGEPSEAIKKAISEWPTKAKPATKLKSKGLKEKLAEEEVPEIEGVEITGKKVRTEQFIKLKKGEKFRWGKNIYEKVGKNQAKNLADDNIYEFAPGAMVRLIEAEPEAKAEDEGGGVDWTTAVRQALEKSQKERGAVKVEQKKGRRSRAGAYEATVKWLVEEQGLSSKEALEKATAVLKGPLTEYQLYEGLDKFLPPETIANAYDDIRTTDILRPYERISTKNAFEKLEKGDVLTLYDVKMITKWRPEFAKVAYERVPLTVRIFSEIEQALGLLKFGAAFDIQTRRQARWLRARHPKLFTQAVGKNMGAYISKLYAEKLAREVEYDPRHEDAVGHGVKFLKHEGERPEQFISAWGEKVPFKIGKTYAASMRGFIDSLNWLQQQLWNYKVEVWEKKGRTITEEMLYDLADFNNTFLGLAQPKTKFGRALRRVLAPVMWSPSLTWSRIRTPSMILTNKTMRIETAVSLASYIGSGMIYLLAASFLFRALDREDPIEWDPRSSDFGKIRVGDTRIDVYGDGGPYIRALVQLCYPGYAKKKTQAGRLRRRPRLETLKQFVRNKRAPFFDFIGKVWSGRTYYGGPAWEIPDWSKIKEEGGLKQLVARVGEKITEPKIGQKAYLITKEVLEKFAPFFVQATVEASWHDGWPLGLAAGTDEFFSGQTLSYKPSTFGKLQMIQDISAVVEYDTLWDDLSPRQQKILRIRIPEINEFEELLAREKLPLEELDLREQNKVAERIRRSLPEEIRKELAPMGYRIIPGLSRRLGDFWLNDERYAKYEKLAGIQIEKRLRKLFAHKIWQSLDISRQEELVKIQINYAKAEARAKLVGKK